MSALAEAALCNADSGAMGALGQMHLAAGNTEAALAWLRKAAAHGDHYALRPAAICFALLAEEREPACCGPLTLAAVGWSALALQWEADPERSRNILHAILLAQSDYGLTPADVEAARANAETELMKEN